MSGLIHPSDIQLTTILKEDAAGPVGLAATVDINGSHDSIELLLPHSGSEPDPAVSLSIDQDGLLVALSTELDPLLFRLRDHAWVPEAEPVILPVAVRSDGLPVTTVGGLRRLLADHSDETQLHFLNGNLQTAQLVGSECRPGMVWLSVGTTPATLDEFTTDMTVYKIQEALSNVAVDYDQPLVIETTDGRRLRVERIVGEPHQMVMVLFPISEPV